MPANELDPSTEPLDQAGNDDLTIDLTQLQPPVSDRSPDTSYLTQVEPSRLVPSPYDQPRQWDLVRTIVTVGLLAMLGWVIVWASIESASWSNHWAQTKEMLLTILPAITGLLGSVIGFYFGSNTNSGGTGNSGKIGSGSGK
jgi:hypothetical protein